MSRNEVAAFDPIFFFHHCNIDRVFYLWQLRHNTSTVETLNENVNNFKTRIRDEQGVDVDTEKGWGFNSNDNQGHTPGLEPNQTLSLQTPLRPFKKEDGEYYVSDDVADLRNLHYTYPIPTLEKREEEEKLHEWENFVARATNLRVKLNKLSFSGPFSLALYATSNEKEHLVDYETVFNRRQPSACPNCVAQKSYSTTLLVPANTAPVDAASKVILRVFTLVGYYEKVVAIPAANDFLPVVDLTDKLSLGLLIKYR
jgi:tyrosinase